MSYEPKHAAPNHRVFRSACAFTTDEYGWTLWVVSMHWPELWEGGKA